MEAPEYHTKKLEFPLWARVASGKFGIFTK